MMPTVANPMTTLPPVNWPLPDVSAERARSACSTTWAPLASYWMLGVSVFVFILWPGDALNFLLPVFRLIHLAPHQDQDKPRFNHARSISKALRYLKTFFFLGWEPRLCSMSAILTSRASGLALTRRMYTK